MKMKNVIGVGNALTDMVVNLPDDAILDAFGLPKGAMSLVDGARHREISRLVADFPHTLSPGGSVANTIRAMARLGTTVGFAGTVGKDSTGDFFESAMRNSGVKAHISWGEGHSGRCVSLVSPDGERTMATHLGAALEMSVVDMTPAVFEGFDCVYLEGYLVQDQSLIHHTARVAKSLGLTVALDLASFNVVEQNLEFLRELVADYVDILFANEAEAEAFTGLSEPVDALREMAKMCDLAIVKTGIEGALIACRGEIVEVGILEAARRVDTTGAGDFYAAGFLYGLCDGLSLRQCGTIGAIVAGKVIEVVGTTLGESAWAEIERLVASVRSDNYLL